MERKFAGWFLIVLVVVAVTALGCGQIPTPVGAGQGGTDESYPPPATAAEDSNPQPTPTPRVTHEIVGVRADLVSMPIYFDRCTPTPNPAEVQNVVDQQFSEAIEFNLQRAIHTSEKLGQTDRPAKVYVMYDPALTTLTETVTLLEEHGFKVEDISDLTPTIYGTVSLDEIVSLATTPGIIKIALQELFYTNKVCPPPGAPTPVPITPGPNSP